MRIIKIEEEIKIPGTEFILEKNDRIAIVEMTPIKKTGDAVKAGWDLANGLSDIVSEISNEVETLISSMKEYIRNSGNPRQQQVALNFANKAAKSLNALGLTVADRID